MAGLSGLSINYNMKTFFVFCSLFFLLVLTNGCSNDQTENDLKATIIRFYDVLIAPGDDHLSHLVSDSLSYGHSSGKVENKSQFIETLVNGNSNFLSIIITDQQITMMKNVAVVRHNLSASIKDKNKPQSNINLQCNT